MHTIKGACGFLGLPRLGSVAHAGENILGKFRDGELEVTPHAVTLILKAIDRIRSLLAEMETSGAEPVGSDEELIGEINAMAADAPAAMEAPLPMLGGMPSFSEDGFPVAAELLVEVAEVLNTSFIEPQPAIAEPAPLPPAPKAAAPKEPDT